MSFNARIKSKRDTASNWETNNPVLLNGELIIVDTNAGDVRFKIGDGVKTYTQLPFQDESLYNVLSTKADSADLESIQASIVQSDLSQTDSTAKDYIKGIIRQESLPEGYPYKDTETILDGTFEFTGSGSIRTYQITDENFTITPGRSYTVIWDGVTYQCVATNSAGLPTIGNLAIAGVTPNTGEPFLFINNTNKLFYTTDTAAAHTIIVHEENVHTIAKELLPEIYFSELIINDPEAAKTALAIENGMVLKNLQAAMPGDECWQSVTYGNGKFVAVSENGSMAAYSEDGVTWTAITMPSNSQWASVTYGNGKFVTVASGSSSNRAAYSEDGITWTAATLPSSSQWQSVTYGNGKFVAVDYSSTNAAYSEDGITWTAATMPSSEYWNYVTYGNGKFVAVAWSTTAAAYSADGITWTSSTMPSSEYWSSVTYGNGKFVAVAQGSTTAAYSADGITWTATTMPSSADWKSITYGNGKFVAVAYNSNKAAYSTDSITWTASTLPSSASWQSVTYGNGKFVAVAEFSVSAPYSEDGITWKTELKTISQNGIDVTADTLIALEHTHEASKISAGTFAGQVVAKSDAQTPGTKLIRNSKLMASADYDAVTDWATVLSEGEIAWRCE